MDDPMDPLQIGYNKKKSATVYPSRLVNGEPHDVDSILQIPSFAPYDFYGDTQPPEKQSIIQYWMDGYPDICKQYRRACVENSYLTVTISRHAWRSYIAPNPQLAWQLSATKGPFTDWPIGTTATWCQNAALSETQLADVRPNRFDIAQASDQGGDTTAGTDGHQIPPPATGDDQGDTSEGHVYIGKGTRYGDMDYMAPFPSPQHAPSEDVMITTQMGFDRQFIGTSNKYDSSAIHGLSIMKYTTEPDKNGLTQIMTVDDYDELAKVPNREDQLRSFLHKGGINTRKVVLKFKYNVKTATGVSARTHCKRLKEQLHAPWLDIPAVGNDSSFIQKGEIFEHDPTPAYPHYKGAFQDEAAHHLKWNQIALDANSSSKAFYTYNQQNVGEIKHSKQEAYQKYDTIMTGSSIPDPIKPHGTSYEKVAVDKSTMKKWFHPQGAVRLSEPEENARHNVGKVVARVGIVPADNFQQLGNFTVNVNMDSYVYCEGNFATSDDREWNERNPDYYLTDISEGPGVDLNLVRPGTLIPTKSVPTKKRPRTEPDAGDDTQLDVQDGPMDVDDGIGHVKFTNYDPPVTATTLEFGPGDKPH